MKDNKNNEKLNNIAIGGMIGVLLYMLFNKFIEPIISNLITIFITDKLNDQSLRAVKVDYEMQGYGRGIDMDLLKGEDSSYED